MVDVAHDGDDRRARRGAGRGGLFHRLQLDCLFERNHFRFEVEVLGDLQGQLRSERSIDGDHETFLHQKVLHQVVGLDAQLVRQLFHGHALGQRDLAGRALELEDLPAHRRGLLARVTAR